MPILDSIERLRAGMDYHLARHNLLTTNLAHVDTPGYRPLDLAQRAKFDGALHAAMTATDERHLGGTTAASGPHAAGAAAAAERSWEVVEDPSAPEGADGNGVRLDREAVKIATNNLRYDALATLVSGQLGTLAWAANDGRGG